MGAAGGTLADQWKEFFYCEAMDKEVMVVKGTKRSSSRSSNKHGSDNVISSGSGIAVADGQCMMIVEQGKVVEVCADPGEYTYDASTEPSIFSGSLGDGIRKTFDTIGKRFAFGGDTGKDQRVTTIAFFKNYRKTVICMKNTGFRFFHLFIHAHCNISPHHLLKLQYQYLCL